MISMLQRWLNLWTVSVSEAAVSVSKKTVSGYLPPGSRTITMDKGSFPAALYQIASKRWTDTMVSWPYRVIQIHSQRIASEVKRDFGQGKRSPFFRGRPLL